jgi:hypothetical protein
MARALPWFAGAFVLAAGVVAVPLGAATLPSPAPGAAMADAAVKFVASLTPEQKKRALYGWEDQTRYDFHFVPMERSGVPLKMLSPEQRALAHALLKTGLSQAGYLKVTQIIELENVLAEIEKNPVKRDPEKYHFWIYGTPEARGTWGWKAEGHHVSLNFTVVKGTAIATTPTFMGSNPGEVREGPLKGRRVLRAEEELGRELALSFDEKTSAKVIIDAKALPDILSFDKSKVDPLASAGVAAGSMTAKQKELLRKLLAEYAGAMPPALAAERLGRIEKAGFDKVQFAWAGGLKPGDAHYYRLQGPTFLVELDNTQNNANHVHTVWRDFERDFGRDLLREHLKAAHTN